MLGFHAWDYALSHKGELAIKAIMAGSIYEEHKSMELLYGGQDKQDNMSTSNMFSALKSN